MIHIKKTQIWKAYLKSKIRPKPDITRHLQAVKFDDAWSGPEATKIVANLSKLEANQYDSPFSLSVLIQLKLHL